MVEDYYDEWGSADDSYESASLKDMEGFQRYLTAHFFFEDLAEIN